MQMHFLLPIFMSQEQNKARKKPKTAGHFHYELTHPRKANSSSKAEILWCSPVMVSPQGAAGFVGRKAGTRPSRIIWAAEVFLPKFSNSFAISIKQNGGQAHVTVFTSSPSQY